MTCRIGAVSYLNTKPLIHGLTQRLPEVELQFDLPSRLADQLKLGQLDIALIPSVEFLRGEDLSIVSDACIACRGPVRSVRVLFRKPPAVIQTLALDVGSRTSAVLSQVLLQQQFGVRPNVRPMAMHESIEQVDADAILIIGDRAMQIDKSQFCEHWDLGQRWNEATGLPFVFAMWVSADRIIGQHIVEALQESRDAGVQDAETIAHQHCGRYGISPQDCLTYFKEQLHFQLGEKELAGLDLFRRQAATLGLLPSTSTHLSLEPI